MKKKKKNYVHNNKHPSHKTAGMQGCRDEGMEG